MNSSTYSEGKYLSLSHIQNYLSPRPQSPWQKVKEIKIAAHIFIALLNQVYFDITRRLSFFDSSLIYIPLESGTALYPT